MRSERIVTEVQQETKRKSNKWITDFMYVEENKGQKREINES